MVKKYETTNVTDELDDDPATTALTKAPEFVVGEVQGEVEMSDIQKPRLNIIQKSGELSELFDFGSIVLMREHTVATMNKSEDLSDPVELVVISPSKFWQDNVPYGSGIVPERYFTKEEVKASKKRLNWDNETNEPPEIEEACDCMIFVKQPEDMESSIFIYEFEGESFAPAFWFMRSSAYRLAAKTIFSKQMLELKVGGLLSGRWELRAKKVTKNGNTYCVPRLQLKKERNSPEFIQWVKDTIQM